MVITLTLTQGEVSILTPGQAPVRVTLTQFNLNLITLSRGEATGEKARKGASPFLPILLVYPLGLFVCGGGLQEGQV